MKSCLVPGRLRSPPTPDERVTLVARRIEQVARASSFVRGLVVVVVVVAEPRQSSADDDDVILFVVDGQRSGPVDAGQVRGIDRGGGGGGCGYFGSSGGFGGGGSSLVS